MRSVIALVLLLLTCSTQAFASDNEEERATVARVVETAGKAYLSKKGAGGLSVAVVSGDNTYFHSFGPLTPPGLPAATELTVYEVGSLTKTLTGLLLAHAIAEGLVRLDDDIRTHLKGDYPNLVFDGQPITLLHLANMTSALPDNLPPRSKDEDSPFARAKRLESYSREDFFRALHQVKLISKPGESPGHSNAASELLGYLLEDLYQKSFAELVQEKIEKPARMTAGRAEGAIAASLDEQGDPMPYLTAAAARASGGLRYSAKALGGYVRYQLKEGDGAIKLTHKPNWKTLDGATGIGFYWIWSATTPAGRRLRYSGGTFGFASFLDLYPDRQLGIVVLTNGADDSTQDGIQRLSEEIVAALPKAERPTVGQRN